MPVTALNSKACSTFRYPDGKVQYQFRVKGIEFVVYCEFVTCMVDGKTRKAMMGRGGGYCYHCSMTCEQYHTPAGVRVEVIFQYVSLIFSIHLLQI